MNKVRPTVLANLLVHALKSADSLWRLCFYECIDRCCTPARCMLFQSTIHLRLADTACMQVALDEEDKQDRFKAAQEPKKYVASGGLTGFRVADDLFKMHLDYAEAAADPEAWREPPKPKKRG